jgi:hypothetical protein
MKRFLCIYDEELQTKACVFVAADVEAVGEFHKFQDASWIPVALLELPNSGYWMADFKKTIVRLFNIKAPEHYDTIEFDELRRHYITPNHIGA